MNHPSLLQSKDWARFQESVGHRVIRSDKIIFYETKIPFGQYLYCPHPDIQDTKQFLSNLVEVAKKENAIFIRVEPNACSASIQYPVSSIKVIPTIPVQPPCTWNVLLDDNEVMLSAMHPKTRYNIRLAEKNGIVVRFSSNVEDVEVFYKLLIKTAKRAVIRLYPINYYRKMVEVLSIKRQSLETETDMQVELAIAEKDNQSIAAGLIAYWQDKVIYLHGGSDYEFRNLMAPHLLHWKIIQRARDFGRVVYDMGGIAPTEQEVRVKNQELSLVNSSHPWAGITRFKMGFGGYAVDYPPAVDVVVKPGYYRIYQILRRINRIFK